MFLVIWNEVKRRRHEFNAHYHAAVTTGGNLPACYVIHAVRPIWRNGDRGEPAKLRSTYANSLLRAEE